MILALMGARRPALCTEILREVIEFGPNGQHAAFEGGTMTHRPEKKFRISFHSMKMLAYEQS